MGRRLAGNTGKMEYFLIPEKILMNKITIPKEISWYLSMKRVSAGS